MEKEIVEPQTEFVEGIDEEYEANRRRKIRIRKIIAAGLIIMLVVWVFKFY